MVCGTNGTPLTRQQVQSRVRAAAKRADVQNGVHVLRHTFCSHLAMEGAAPTAVQALAGHSDLGVTQRYMHLSPSALGSAIELLNRRGNMTATAAREIEEAVKA